MTMTTIHEGETIKQMSGGTCPVTVVLPKQATHAPKAHTTNAGALPGQKVKKNAVSFQMESKSGPCGPDVHGPADDAGFLRKILVRSAPHGDRLDLALVGRRPFDILTLGELSILKSGHTAATGSYHVVLWPLQVVLCVVETFRGGRAPKQARRAGIHGRQAGTQGR